jgi:NitT/TauT family transport system substrate-binding protein
MRRIDRRQILTAGLGAGALVLTPAGDLRAESNPTARWAFLTPGFTVLVVQYIAAKKLIEKNGAPLAPPTEYSAVSTYYNDFVAGNVDICIGSWDVFAARYQAGVPIQLLCTITTADMIFILTGDKDITKIEDLRGKTVAAAQSTGTFRMVSALIKEHYGIELGKDVAIQGVDNPAAAVTLVMANRAAAGLSWEPNISAALKRQPTLRTIFNAGESYRERTTLDLPYFGVAVRSEWAKQNPEATRRIRQTFADCISGINADPDDAVMVAGKGSGFPPDVMAEALKSRRLRFRFGSMADPAEQQSVLKASEFMQRNGLLSKALDQGFFATL